jgi:Ferritin-like domain
MNLQNILTEIEKVDAEVYDKLDSRRNVMKSFANVTGKLALAAVPLALGSMFQKAYGRGTGITDVLSVLNYALTLEYLEYNFYLKAVASGVIPAGAPTAALTTIRNHEGAHVTFLTNAITASGGTPISFTASQFDFTAGGAFPTVFTDYAVLLAVAQTFEDTGVRAYKGQAANLISNNDVLTAALNIHSVEARHAAHVRSMRRANGGLVPNGVTVKPWITGNQSGIGTTAVQASYNGEEITTQAGINIVNINSLAISANAASEAFDEPLDETSVRAIVAPFFA